MIKFDEKLHKYTNTRGVEYISVTTLIGKYKPKFDVEKMSALVAQKEGLTQQFVKDVWEETKNIACDRGTTIHKIMENWLLDKQQEPNEYIESIERIWHPNKLKITPEKLLWSDIYQIAGTTDVCEDHTDYFNLYDYKTNKAYRFNTNSRYNEYMLYPLNHMPVCEFTTYSLQLSLYAYLYSKMCSKQVGELACFYYDKDHWVKYNTPYLKYEVLMMLNDWKNKYC